MIFLQLIDKNTEVALRAALTHVCLLVHMQASEQLYITYLGILLSFLRGSFE